MRKEKKRSKTKKSPSTARWTSFWEDRSIAFRFLALFAILIGLFYVFYFSEFNVKHIHPHLTATQAKLGAFLLNLMGRPVSALDENISGDGFSMSVSGGCDGLEVTALFVAAVLAFPSTWKEKWKGLLYGIGVLTVLNLFRLPVLFLAGASGSTALFDFLHIQGGFIIFISITLLLWGYWVIQVQNQRNLDSTNPDLCHA